MSVINQVLIELEKRRASGPERSALPGHVRALPQGERSIDWAWVAAGGIAAVAGLAGAWVMLTGFDVTRQRAPALPPAQPVAAAALPAIAAAPAQPVAGARPRSEPEVDAQPEAFASRLSFELANVPAARPLRQARKPAPSEPLVSRIIALADGTSQNDATPVPVERRETAAAPVAIASAQSPGRVPAAPSSKVASGAPAAKPQIQKQERPPTPRELADAEYRKAATALNLERYAEAEEGFQAALNRYPAHHGARQGLVGALVAGKKFAEAERVLEEGVRLAPAQIGFTMTLARLQLDRGDNARATATLQENLEHARGNPDYLAFLGTLLQRQGRHEEAIEPFQAALRIRPGVGVWWLGLGISLQAANRVVDAQEAYRRARATNSLNPDLAAFAEQRMRQSQ